MPLGILNNLSPVNRDHHLASGLVSWYLALPHFASGGFWPDLGIQQNTGVFTAATWATSQRPGGFGACATFNGTTAYVAGTSISMPVGNLAPIAIAFWCRTSTLTGFRTPYFYGGTAANRGVLFAQDGTANDGTIDVGIVGSNFIQSTRKLVVNTWMHVCLSYDGATATLYLNGVQDSQAAATINPSGAGSNNIGTYDKSSQFWSGQVDDVRLYWRPLPATEVKELYDNSTQGCPGLLNFTQPQFLSLSPVAVVAAPSTIALPGFALGPPMPKAPWFRLMAIPGASPAAPALLSLPSTDQLPPFVKGPPQPGTPWFRLQPAFPTVNANPPAAVQTQTLPAFTTGPPMPGAPWFRLQPAASSVQIAVVAPTVQGTSKGHSFTLIRRDPNLGNEPVRRSIDILAVIMNSLIAQGYMVQTGPASWKLAGTAGTGLTGTFP